MITRTRDKPSGDTGAVAITVALLAIVLAGIAAFTTDFGIVFTQSRLMQVATDGAALAAAQELAADAKKELAIPTSAVRTCPQILSAYQAAARASAVTYHALNAPTGAALATGTAPSGWSGDAGVAYRCVTDGDGQAAEVQVSDVKTTPSIFGGVAGVSSHALAETSTAAMGAGQTLAPGCDAETTIGCGVRPFGFCTTLINQLESSAAGGLTDFYLDNTQLFGNSPTALANGCASGTGGNWGVLYFCGGDPSYPQCNSTQRQDWLASGVDLGVQCPTTGTSASTACSQPPAAPNGSYCPPSPSYWTAGCWLPGLTANVTGNTGSCDTRLSGVYQCPSGVSTVQQAFDAILGAPSAVPVYDDPALSGSNSYFVFRGFAGLRICGYHLSNTNYTTTVPTGCNPTPAFYTGGGGGYDPTTTGIQKQSYDGIWVEPITVGGITGTCGLPGSTVVCYTTERPISLVN
jgi:Flp pilus assembly protein TadG